MVNTHSQADLIDLTDLPEVGTPEFLAALTEEQRQQFHVLQADEAGATYQVTLREQTILDRRVQHQNNFPLSDNLMSLIFLVHSDLNEQQRERFVSSMSNPTDCHASVHIPAREAVVPRALLCVTNMVGLLLDLQYNSEIEIIIE